MYFKRNRYVPSNGKSTKMAIDIFPYSEKYQENSAYPDDPTGIDRDISRDKDSICKEQVLCYDSGM
jgi:hypothetical protein